MTSVLLNKVGMDLVDVVVTQKGDSMTDMFFQDPVLDYTREYVLGVSELVVPLGEEPMLSSNPTNNVLITVRRKGIVLGGAADAQLKYLQSLPAASLPAGVAGNAAAEALYDSRNPGMSSSSSRFECSKGGVKIQTAAQFYDDFRKWLKNLDHKLASGDAVAAGYNLRLLVSPGGTMTIQGDNGFWRQYYFELSQYGRRLLGAEQLYIHMGLDGTSSLAPGNFLAGPQLGDGWQVHPGPDGNGVITPVPAADNQTYALPPQQNQPFAFTFNHSALRYMDSRLRVEVDADLSIPANILVENGEQKKRRCITTLRASR